MSYLDSSDAQLIALTRQRRAEAAAKMMIIRQAHESLKFPAVQKHIQDQIERDWQIREGWNGLWPPPHVVWKRDQWDSGNRHCGYCRVHMTRQPNVPRTCTVDHRIPRALGGQDVASNWKLACLDCNNRKGMRTESEFLKALARETAFVR